MVCRHQTMWCQTKTENTFPPFLCAVQYDESLQKHQQLHHHQTTLRQDNTVFQAVICYHIQVLQNDVSTKKKMNTHTVRLY